MSFQFQLKVQFISKAHQGKIMCACKQALPNVPVPTSAFQPSGSRVKLSQALKCSSLLSPLSLDPPQCTRVGSYIASTERSIRNTLWRTSSLFYLFSSLLLHLNVSRRIWLDTCTKSTLRQQGDPSVLHCLQDSITESVRQVHIASIDCFTRYTLPLCLLCHFGIFTSAMHCNGRPKF